MKYFMQVKDNKIISYSNLPAVAIDTENIETTQEIYSIYLQDKDRVIYKNGAIIIDPDYDKKKEEKERERIAKLSLTKREVFLALYKDKGVTPEEIRKRITDVAALIEFDYANDYFRGNPLIDQIGAELGYTSDDLDYLFQYKQLPENNN